MNPYRSTSIITAMLLALLTASVALGQAATKKPVEEAQQQGLVKTLIDLTFPKHP